MDNQDSKFGRIVANVAVVADAGLIALTAWVTAFIAGAPITKESVFTGPVTAAFAVHVIAGGLAAMFSAVATVATWRVFEKGNSVRQRVGNWWLCAHLFFVIAMIANSVYVSIRLG